MDWVFGKVANRSGCGASLEVVNITDLDFANNAVILAEILENLVSALEK